METTKEHHPELEVVVFLITVFVRVVEEECVCGGGGGGWGGGGGPYRKINSSQ